MLSFCWKVDDFFLYYFDRWTPLFPSLLLSAPVSYYHTWTLDRGTPLHGHSTVNFCCNYLHLRAQYTAHHVRLHDWRGCGSHAVAGNKLLKQRRRAANGRSCSCCWWCGSCYLAAWGISWPAKDQIVCSSSSRHCWGTTSEFRAWLVY